MSRFAPRKCAAKPLYRLGKVHLRSRTRVGARILGNTIGNLAADAVAGGGKPKYKLIHLAAAADSSGIMYDSGLRPGEAALADAAQQATPTDPAANGEIVVKAHRGFLDWVDGLIGTNLGGHNPHTRSESSSSSSYWSFNWSRAVNSASSGANYIYNGTIGPNTIFGRYIVKPVDDAFYGTLGVIANSPLGDPGTIMSLESSGVGALPGGALAGIRGLAELGGTARVARAVEGISIADDPLAAATGRIVTGETVATATGKSVHAELAAARRASGEFDLVNAPLADADGLAIQVPRRVDLSTGAALDTRLQIARPDAVRFSDRVILDDKPLGRAIWKDRQEMIRFIDAYQTSQGQLPNIVAIQRYDPVTRLPVHTELYSPWDFLPKGP